MSLVAACIQRNLQECLESLVCVSSLLGQCNKPDLVKQCWQPKLVVVCSPVGGASDETLQQPSVQHSVTTATDNAVRVAEQNRQAAAEALMDVKQQIGH